MQALNTVYTFCSARKSMATTYETLKGGVENLLRRCVLSCLDASTRLISNYRQTTRDRRHRADQVAHPRARHVRVHRRRDPARALGRRRRGAPDEAAGEGAGARRRVRDGWEGPSRAPRRREEGERDRPAVRVQRRRAQGGERRRQGRHSQDRVSPLLAQRNEVLTPPAARRLLQSLASSASPQTRTPSSRRLR